MKILVVVPDMNLGGVASSVINFCNELSDRGENVYFLNIGKKNPNLENKIEKNVKHIQLSGSATRWNLGVSDLKCASFIQKLKLIPLAIIKKLTNRSEQWLRIIFRGDCIKEEFDVVVAFRQCAPCYFFVLNCTRAKKKIAFIHGDINYMGDISSWDIYFDKFNAIACVSDAVKRGFQNHYPNLKEKFVTVYNMFNIQEIRRKAKLHNEKVYLDENICNIVTVARIENSTKRIDIIPQICAILKKYAENKFHWYVIGDGPDLEDDKILADNLKINDVLTFCGSFENPYPIMEKATFTVLPSKTEAYGMVILESIILGKPVIVSRYEAVEEVVSDGVTGLIADQSIEDLVKKIKLLISDYDMRNTLKLNIRKLEISNDVAYNQFMCLME